MADGLSAPVKNGEISQYTSNVLKKAETKGTTALGKDAFLQLLCTQMQYQDPLNPSSDTEFISQLASFSSLEQMQNLNSTFSQAQAFSLVGQQVQVKADNAAGFIEGKVDFVTVSNGKSYLSIGGNRFEADKLLAVVDPYFVAKQNAPTISEQKLKYDHEKPEDLTIKIDLGKDTGKASSFLVMLNGEVVDKKYLAYDEKSNKVTISKDALAGIKEGTHKVMFLFDDVSETTITDKVTVEVSGKPVKPETDKPETDKPETDKPETDKAETDKTQK